MRLVIYLRPLLLGRRGRVVCYGTGENFILFGFFVWCSLNTVVKRTGPINPRCEMLNWIALFILRAFMFYYWKIQENTVVLLKVKFLLIFKLFWFINVLKCKLKLLGNLHVSWIIKLALNNLSKLTVILSKSREVHNNAHRHLPYHASKYFIFEFRIIFFQLLLFVDAINISRYFFIFVLKNPFALHDDFW